MYYARRMLMSIRQMYVFTVVFYELTSCPRLLHPARHGGDRRVGSRGHPIWRWERSL